MITSPYTFAATAEVIRYFSCKPVFIHIDPYTFSMNPNGLEHAMNPRTRVIPSVHMAGYPAEMECILETAQRHSLPVVEDAVHSVVKKFKR